MPEPNPYLPPDADVEDVAGGTVVAYQKVRLWSAAGRIGRLRYMAYLSAGFMVLSASSFAAGFATAITQSFSTAFAVMLFSVLAFLAFWLMLMIQRSHDMGWSGWSVRLALIPFVAAIWMFWPGTRGPNRYGMPPPPNRPVHVVFGVVVPIVGILMMAYIVVAVAIPAYENFVLQWKAMQTAPQ